MAEKTRPRFMRVAPAVQALMASGDHLTGSYAMLYAVGRGSVGFIQGLITSIQQLGAALLQPVWGAWSDRVGRKWFMAMGLLIQAFAWGVLLPLADTSFKVLMVITLQTLFGTMVLPVWNAWLGDYTEKTDRGRIFGKFGMLSAWISLIVFTGVSLYINAVDPGRQNVDSYSIAFRGAGLFYLIGAFSILLLPQAQRFNGKVRTITYWQMVSGYLINRSFRFRARLKDEVRGLNGSFKKFLLIDGIFRIAWSIAWPIFPYATLSATEGWIELIILEVTIGISIGLSQLIGGRVSDNMGRKKVILWTRIFLVLPPLLTGFAVLYKQPALLVLSNLSVGLTLGATGIAINSLILDTAPEGKESTYFSIHIFTMGIIGFLSSVTMGWILSIVSGDVIPSDQTVATLLFVASFMRLFAWITYFFLPETNLDIMSQ